MNKEIKEKWIAALRSGKYQQAKNFLKVGLKEDFKFCCLGVLREECFLHLHQANKIILSPPELDAAQLTEDQQHRLAKLNDTGSIFSEIADIIEQEY